MKSIYKSFLVISILLISQIIIAQNRQWMSPDNYNNINKTGLKVLNVKFYSDATVIEFQYDNYYGQAGWVQLSRNCEIKAYPSGRTYKLVSASGIPYAPSKHNFNSVNEKLSFTCVFPAVPDGTRSLDWIEEGDWVITGICSQSGTSVDNSGGAKLGTQSSYSSASTTQEKQKWVKPVYTTTTGNKGLELTEVNIDANQTVLWFTYTNHYSYGGWVSLDKGSKIIAYPSGKTLYLTKKTDGIPFSPEKHNFSKSGERLRFNLFFPAVPAGTTKIDFIESSSSDWKLYGIRPSSSSNVTTSSTSSREPATVTVGKSVSTTYHTWTFKSMDLTSSKTVCHWSVTPKQRDTYIQMTQGVYLVDNKGKKYYMTSCDGISMAPKQDAIYNIRTVDYTVTFPAIDADATSVTYYSSSTFQIKDINISRSQSFSYGNSSTIQDNTNSANAFSVSNSMTFNAYASSFCYPQGNGEWSEFSEWKNCDFTINYEASSQLVIFNTAHMQKYKVLSHENPDPSILTLDCQDTTNGAKCEIEFVSLPDNEGMQIYLSFPDERICYAVKAGTGPTTTSQLTSISSQGNSIRVLPGTISYPSCSKAYTNSGMTLTKVTSDNYQTVLDFEYIYSEDQDGGIWLSPTTCIKAYPSGTKYKMTRVEGIGSSSDSANGHHYKGEKAKFKVFFPSLPANTTHFDFMEEGQMSDWVLCGISNTPQYKRDFLMLNSSDVSQSITWEWYGGQKTFYVATTAYDYDIVGLPDWCEVTTKVAEGFQIKCKGYGNEELSDYFIVKANGMETRVNIKCKKYYEYSSPQASISNVDVSHWSYTKKISVTPTAVIKNMSGKKLSLCAYLINPNGELINDVSASLKEITPNSSSYNLSATSLIIDYGVLGISDLTGYTIGVGLYDNDNETYFAASDQVPVIKKNRSEIASAIRSWGKCRLVAITEMNGDIAINGGNGYNSNGLPAAMLNDLKEIRDMKEAIQDISLTERGEYVIIYGNNGIRCSNNIPNAMYEVLKRMNNDREKITSAVLNDDGDWIVISEDSFNASSPELQNLMKEGLSQYGGIYSACLTNNGYIIVYEKGYKSGGDLPSTLGDAISKTTINVYTIKVAGDSWFFADKEGRYQMSL